MVVPCTGASAATVAHWYAQRGQQPEGRRHPEVACTVGRIHYFNQEAVEAFWSSWQEDAGTGHLQAVGRPPGDGRGNPRRRVEPVLS